MIKQFNDQTVQFSISQESFLLTNYCLTWFTCILFLLLEYVFLLTFLTSSCLSFASVTTFSEHRFFLGVSGFLTPLQGDSQHIQSIANRMGSIYVHSFISFFLSWLIGWGCKIHWLLLCRGIRAPPRNESPGYDTQQSDGEIPVMLELWGMRCTPLLPLFPSPLWSRVVAPKRVLSMGQIELNCVLIFNWIA